MNGAVLAANGELDLATAPHFEAAVRAHPRRRPTMLTVDLSAVTFM
jgi:anti-anti-sigma regulatory factor